MSVVSPVCVKCGGVGAVLVGIVASASGPDRPQYACTAHAPQHQPVRPRRRSRKAEAVLDALARTRAEVTGESIEQARAALAGGGRGGVS